MIEQFKFGRFDHRTVAGGYAYTQQAGKDARWHPQDISMEAPGSHWSVTISNYMRADVFVLNSLRTAPQCIPSIFEPERHMLNSTDNVVVVELRSRENICDVSGKAQVRQNRKITIQCPGYYLEKNSLFIEELGWYLTIASRIEPTRAQLIQDSREPQASDLMVPASVIKPTPIVVFGDYAALVRNSIERMDRIQVRVGVPLDRASRYIPDKVKTLRVSVLDQDFIPFTSGRMTYDPALGEDDLVLESIHTEFSEPLRTTFSHLHAQYNRTLYLDTQEQQTLSGPRCGMVVFADRDALSTYIFSHDATELYNELSSRVIGETSSYTMRKQIQELTQALNTKHLELNQMTENWELETSRAKTLKRQRDAVEETLKRIQNHTTESMSHEAVMAEITNEWRKIGLERDRIEADRDELLHKQSQAKLATKASIWKSLADMVKSSWGIIAIAAGAIPVILKTVKSLKTS